MTFDQSNNTQEDRRVEYSALRSEILQADNICFLMMGYLITSVGFLYSVKLEWLVSLLSFISLCYFTEKRFNIRKIAKFIADQTCQDDSGFKWEKYVQELRRNGGLRPFGILRPYNAEIMTCVIIALSPLVQSITWNSTSIFWSFFAILTLSLSIINYIKYNNYK